jgi:CubicO group peptidase (beta-lactamase class C family)
MLLNGGELNGVRLLTPQSVNLFTTARRVGMYDETFRHKIDWGLGFLICSKKYGYKALPYSFGPHASDRAFGHNGFQSSTAFADPEYGLVIAIAPNGTPGEPAHDKRLRHVLGAVYEDLGITATS